MYPPNDRSAVNHTSYYGTKRGLPISSDKNLRFLIHRQSQTISIEWVIIWYSISPSALEQRLSNYTEKASEKQSKKDPDLSLSPFPPSFPLAQNQGPYSIQENKNRYNNPNNSVPDQKVNKRLCPDPRCISQKYAQHYN